MKLLTNTADGLSGNGGATARRHSTVVRALAIDYAGAQEQVVARANVVGETADGVKGEP